MYDVFISHKWGDSGTDGGPPPLEFAEALEKALADRGVTAFLDKTEIDPFSEITSAVKSALARSKVIVPILSRDYFDGLACSWELMSFLAAGIGAVEPLSRIHPINIVPASTQHFEDTPLKTANVLSGAGFKKSKKQAAPYDRFPDLSDCADAIAKAVSAINDPVGTTTFGGELTRQSFGSLRSDAGFVGRNRDLMTIHRCIFADDQPMSQTHGSSVQINGYAGRGKTLLAHRYARLFGGLFEGGVYVIDVNETADVSTVNAEIALKLALEHKSLNPSQLNQTLRRLIFDQGKTLWLVDNCDNVASLDALKKSLPIPDNAKVIYTRQEPVDGGVSPIHLDPLSFEEANRVLTRWLSGGQKQRLSDEEKQAISKIARLLRVSTLALRLASAIAGEISVGNSTPFTEYQRLLEKDSFHELEAAGQSHPYVADGYNPSVARAAELAFARLSEHALALLQVLALFAPEPIDLQIVRSLDSHDMFAKLEERERPSRTIAKLFALDLVTKTLDGTTVALHRLVRDECVQTSKFKDWKSSTGSKFGRSLFKIITDANSARPLSSNSRHIESIGKQLADQLQKDVSTITDADFYRARSLAALGDLDGAEALQEKVLEDSERILPEDHPNTIKARNNLAVTLYSLGDLDGAKALQEKVLEDRERILPKDHPDTISARANLANTLYGLGDLDGAKALQEQVLEDFERILPEVHPDTISARANLAATLGDLGDLNAAKALEEKVLEDRERILPKDHPDTIKARANLAATLYSLGDLDGAKALQEKVLEDFERILPKDHHDTIKARANLAATLAGLGDLDGAKALEEKVLEDRERILPKDHPDTISARNNLAITLKALEDRDSA